VKTIKKYALGLFIFCATSICAQSNTNFFFKDISRIETYREVIALGILRTANCKNFKELRENMASKYKQIDKNSVDFADHRNHSFLLLLVATNNIEIVKKLLDNSVSFNIRNDKGLNALAFLAIHAKIFNFDPTQMAELLMKHGANPTMVDNYGYNAVDYAKTLGYSQLLEMFKRKGC